MGNITEQDIAALKALVEKWVRMMSTGDWDRLAETTTDDVIFFPPDHPIVEGKDASKAWFEEFPPLTAFTSSIVDVEGRDDFACVRATMVMTMESESGAPGVTAKGKWIATFRKQPDGRWLCVWDIWNLDAPMAAG